MFVLCVVVQYLVYFLVLHLMVKERETWLLYFNCILDVMWHKFCIFPKGAVGWSTVCDCGIYWS